nr:unnamed protein product [Spirometra erinaceieuropaei]
MHQPPPDAAYNAPRINVDGAHLQVMNHFIYLGSTLSRSTKMDDEVTLRIFKPSEAFSRLQNTHDLNRPSSLRPPLPHLLRRQITLAATEPPLPSFFSCSCSSCSSSSPSSSSSYSSPHPPSSTASTSAVVASATHINITHNPDILTNTSVTTVDTRGEDLVCAGPHCDRTFASRIGLEEKEEKEEKEEEEEEEEEEKV